VELSVLEVDGGYVLFARKMQKSDVWFKKPAWWFKVWCYLIMEVNHKERGKFKRGQGFFSRDKIHQDCSLELDGIKTQTVDNVLRWLKLTKRITTQQTTRGFILTVLKYDDYQDSQKYKFKKKDEPQNELQDELKTNLKRTTNEPIHNNDKNDKNVKNDKENTLGNPNETKTPLLKVIKAYRIKKFPEIEELKEPEKIIEIAKWNKHNIPKLSKFAKELLDYLGSWQETVMCIDELGTEFDDNPNIKDWSLSAISKNASRWKLKQRR